MPLFASLKKLFQRIRGEKQTAEIDNLDKQLVTSLEPWKLPRFGQLKFLPRFLSAPEKWLIKFAIGMAILALIVLSILFSQNLNNFKPRPGGILREGIVGQPQFINPVHLFNDTDRDLSNLIYSSLVRYDAKGNIVPDLADTFQISDDGKTYSFHLRNALWHDGEPVTSGDIIFTIQTIQDPVWVSPLWRSLKGVQVEAVDDHTIKFQTEKPFAPFLSLLTGVDILPKHIWEDIEPQNMLLTIWNIEPVGSGPWRYDSLIKNKNGRLLSYTVAKNENYFNSKPYISKIEFIFYDDLRNALQGLKEGNIDSLAGIPAELAGESPTKRVRTYEMNLPSYTAIFFNERRNDFLADRNIRQALLLSINKTELLEKTKNGKNIDGPLPPGFWGMPPSLFPNNYDPERANQLIANEGLQKKNQYWQKKDNILTLNLTVLENSDYLETANFIKGAWEAIGVKTSLNILSSKNFKEAVKNRNFEAILWSQNLGRDPDLFPFWHSSQASDPGLNLTSFNNRQADTILEEARNTLDSQKRTLLYLDFQKIITSETPAIFLFQKSYLYAVSKKINGVEINKLGATSDRFAGSEDWFIKKWLR